MVPIKDMPTLRLVAPSHRERLVNHVNRWSGCKNCSFGVCNGKKVYFRGYIPAPVLFLGEAPGWSEHSSGLPFCGPSGQVLDEIIQGIYARLGLDFKWCVGNSVLCTPLDENMETCTPKIAQLGPCSHRLHEFVQIVEPEIIVRVGTVAQRALPTEIRTTNHDGKNLKIKTVDCYHPAWVLRQLDQTLQKKKIIFSLSQFLEENLNAATR